MEESNIVHAIHSEALGIPMNSKVVFLDMCVHKNGYVFQNGHFRFMVQIFLRTDFFTYVIAK